jgi:mRNA interferase RelE/StbE
MKVIISPKAERELENLPKIDQIALAKKIRSLISTQVINEEKLKGYKNIFRTRVGNYRIVYRKTIKEIYIILIGHRKNIYDLLKRLF